MLHNTRKRFQFRNTRKKLSSRRQILFQMKKKKRKKIKENSFIYIYLNDKKLINRINAFFMRTSRTRMR